MELCINYLFSELLSISKQRYMSNYWGKLVLFIFFVYI